MNERLWLKRALCVSLVVFLLLIFCAAGHDCHQDHCPMCMLTASFRLTLGLAALIFGLFCLRCWHLTVDAQRNAAGRGGTLVALKVKLSD